jgi:hypothetical protein
MKLAYDTAVKVMAKERGPDQPLDPKDLPSIRAVSRKKYRNYDAEQVMGEKLGADTAGDVHRPRLAAPRYSRIGEHFEIDTVFINVFFQRKSGGAAIKKKCAVFQVVDGATRAWLAHAVRFDAPDAELAGRALYRAMLPTAVSSVYGDGRPMVVIPEATSFDWGPEAKNGTIPPALWRVHVQDIVTPKGLGRAKPDVERLNGTFKGRLPPGGLKLVIDDKRDGEPVSNQDFKRFMLAELDSSIKRLREEYLDSTPSGLNGRTPRQVFAEMMADIVLAPSKPSSRDRVAALRFCKAEETTLTNDGVEIGGLRYQSRATGKLLRLHRKTEEKFTILTSPDDLSRIGILIPDSDEIIELALIYPLEAASMTEDQWWESKRPWRLSQRHAQRIATLQKQAISSSSAVSRAAHAAAAHDSVDAPSADLDLQSLANDNAGSPKEKDLRAVRTRQTADFVQAPPPPAAGPVSEAESAEASFWLPRSSSTSQT